MQCHKGPGFSLVSSSEEAFHDVGAILRAFTLIDQSFYGCSLDALAEGEESLVKPTFGLFGVLINQGSASSFISMDNW